MGKALNFLLQDFDAVAAPQHTDIHMDGTMMLDLCHTFLSVHEIFNGTNADDEDPMGSLRATSDTSNADDEGRAAPAKEPSAPSTPQETDDEHYYGGLAEYSIKHDLATKENVS